MSHTHLKLILQSDSCKGGEKRAVGHIQVLAGATHVLPALLEASDKEQRQCGTSSVQYCPLLNR